MWSLSLRFAFSWGQNAFKSFYAVILQVQTLKLYLLGQFIYLYKNTETNYDVYSLEAATRTVFHIYGHKSMEALWESGCTTKIKD